MYTIVRYRPLVDGARPFALGSVRGLRTPWYGMVWYGMVWYGMVWYGMVWYGAV